MAEFSADAEQRALEPWTIEIGGHVYTASPISRRDVLAFYAVAERSRSGTVTPLEEDQALATLFRAAFPKRLSYWWTGDPVALIMALDYRTRQRAVESFFESLAPLESPRSTPGTNGTNGSRPSSAAANGSPPAAPSMAMGGGSRRD